MTLRRHRSNRLLVAAAALTVTLTGCSSQLIPGVAAEVNGVRITQNQVDNLVMAACDYSYDVRRDRQQAQPGTSMRSLKNTLTEALIQFQITKDAAKQAGVKVSPAKVAQVAGANRIPPQLTGTDRELISGFFKAAALAQLRLAVIGAQQTNPAVHTAAHVTPADVAKATAPMKKFAAHQHVVVNPAYGSWNGTRLVDTSGSLSQPVSKAAIAAVSGPASPQNLPASQVCG